MSETREQNGQFKPKSLDAKIASALAANGEASRDTLVELIAEAYAAIDMARVVIEAETPRLLDLSNLEPDKSRQLIESSKLSIERLTRAIRRLQERVDTIDHQTAVANCEAEWGVVEKKFTALWNELAEVYPARLSEIMALCARIREAHWEAYDLAKRSPKGVNTEFNRIEPYEGFWDKMVLPDWDDPNVTHPPKRPSEAEAFEESWRRFALQSATFAKTLDQKHAQRYSADWHEIQKLEIEQNRIKAAEDEEKQRQAQEESLKEFYKADKAAEMRRIGINPESGQPEGT